MHLRIRLFYFVHYNFDLIGYSKQTYSLYIFIIILSIMVTCVISTFFIMVQPIFDINFRIIKIVINYL